MGGVKKSCMSVSGPKSWKGWVAGKSWSGSFMRIGPVHISDSQHASCAGEGIGSFESSSTWWAACTYSHCSAAASGTGVMQGRPEVAKDDNSVSCGDMEASLTVCDGVPSELGELSRVSRGRPS